METFHYSFFLFLRFFYPLKAYAGDGHITGVGLHPQFSDPSCLQNPPSMSVDNWEPGAHTFSFGARPNTV